MKMFLIDGLSSSSLLMIKYSTQNMTEYSTQTHSLTSGFSSFNS